MRGRSLRQHRNDLVEIASQHVQHAKSFDPGECSVQTCDLGLMGLTGLAVLDGIVAAEHDPAVLARLRDPRIKASEEIIRKSLEG